jgi:hypothetical protein
MKTTTLDQGAKKAVFEMQTRTSVKKDLLEIAGWAIDESGATAVRIYFDDDLVATPDIINGIPHTRKRGPVHGFMQIIDAGAHAGYNRDSGGGD